MNNLTFQLGDKRISILRATPERINIHTELTIKVGNIIQYAGMMLLVKEIQNQQKSNYYPGLKFYELKFKQIKNGSLKIS